MADELKVIVSADASRLTTEMTKATASLQKFEKGSAQATNAMTNLGRVVQDAPYGFIGVANNINPLLESFQRLKVETGSTSTAFKALGSSLLGAGGLGFAVSAITSLLVVFGGKLGSTADETKPVAKGIDEIAEAAKRAKEDITALGNAFSFALEQGNLLTRLNFGGSFQGRLITAQQKSVSLAQELADLQNEYDDLQKQVTEEYAKQAPDVEKITKLTARQSELIKETNKLLNEQKTAQLAIRVLQADELRDIEKKKKKVEEIKAILYEVPRAKKLLPDISDNELINFQNQVQEGVNSLPGNIVVPAAVKLVGSKEFNDEINAKVFKPIENYSALLAEAVQGTINSLIDGIGQAFSGDVGGGLNSIFKGLLNVVGDFLIQLGLAAIGIGKLYAAIKAGQFNPGLTIASGIAALVLGTVIKAFVPKFAVGTNFSPGGLSLVGERGPELINLPKGSRVTPAAQTAASLNGGLNDIRVYGVMRGRDIYFTNQRYGQTFNTTT